MKRLLAIILCLSAVICFSGCSKNESGKKNTAEISTGETTSASAEKGDATSTAGKTGTGKSETTSASAEKGDATSTAGKSETTATTLPPETVDVNEPHTLEDIEEGDEGENTQTEELPEFIGGGAEFEGAKQYDTIPEALAAAGIDLPGLADKFAEFGIRDITVMEDSTVSVRVNYSNSYYDYRINASKAPYIGDVDESYTGHSAPKTSDSNVSVTIYGEAEGSYYLAVWKYGKYCYSMVSGEPLPWEEFNWVISE